MLDKELFDKCLRKAIEIGRPYMRINEKAPYPTKEEWQLALIFFAFELNKGGKT